MPAGASSPAPRSASYVSPWPAPPTLLRLLPLPFLLLPPCPLPAGPVHTCAGPQAPEHTSSPPSRNGRTSGSTCNHTDIYMEDSGSHLPSLSSHSSRHSSILFLCLQMTFDLTTVDKRYLKGTRSAPPRRMVLQRFTPSSMYSNFLQTTQLEHTHFPIQHQSYLPVIFVCNFDDILVPFPVVRQGARPVILSFHVILSPWNSHSVIR